MFQNLKYFWIIFYKQGKSPKQNILGFTVLFPIFLKTISSFLSYLIISRLVQLIFIYKTGVYIFKILPPLPFSFEKLFLCSGRWKLGYQGFLILFDSFYPIILLFSLKVISFPPYLAYIPITILNEFFVISNDDDCHVLQNSCHEI